jgi:hypothetical protein
MHMSLISDDSRHDATARTVVAIRTEVDRTRFSGSVLRQQHLRGERHRRDSDRNRSDEGSQVTDAASHSSRSCFERTRR